MAIINASNKSLSYQERQIRIKSCCTLCKVLDRDTDSKVVCKLPYRQFDDVVHYAYARMCLSPHPGQTNGREYLL